MVLLKLLDIPCPEINIEENRGGVQEKAHGLLSFFLKFILISSMIFIATARSDEPYSNDTCPGTDVIDFNSSTCLNLSGSVKNGDDTLDIYVIHVIEDTNLTYSLTNTYTPDKNMVYSYTNGCTEAPTTDLTGTNHNESGTEPVTAGEYRYIAISTTISNKDITYTLDITAPGCSGGGGGGTPSVPSTADIVDADTNTTSQILKTRVSGGPDTQYIVAYLNPTTMLPMTYNSVGLFNWKPPLEALLYRSDSTCTDELPLAIPTTGNPAGEPVMAVIQDGSDHAYTNIFTMAYIANQDTRIVAKYADWGDILDDLNSTQSCFLNSNWEGNLNGLPQCLNNLSSALTGGGSGLAQELFAKYPNIATICLDQNLSGEQQPCNSSAYDNSGSKGFIVPEKYNHAYGCLACILDNSVNVRACSRDNFAIRPASYSMDLNDSTPLKIAGRQYTLDANATYISGGNNNISGYTTTLNNTFDKNASFVFNPVPTATICPYGDQPFTYTFTDGAGADAISYADVGDVNITLADENWTEVDQNKSPLQCLPDSNSTTPDAEGRVGCLIKASIPERFIPDRFDVNASLTDFGNNFTYLYDMNLYNDYNLSTATLSIDINATSADGNVTTNYVETCYAKDTNITLQTSGTQVIPADALTLFLYYNPAEANGTVNSGEGNASLPPSGIITSLPITNITTSFPLNAPDGNGTTHIEYKLNFDRKVNRPVDPFRISLTNADVNDTDGVTGSDSTTDTATFLYGRAHAPRYRVDCSSSTGNCASQPLLIYFEFYSKDSNLPLRRDAVSGLNIGDQLRSNDAILWFRNTNHMAADGNTTSVAQRYIVSSPITPSVITHNGNTDQQTYTYSGNDGYPYKASMELNASRWLIYNRFEDNATSNNFQLEFNAGPGNKAGTDNLGGGADTGAGANTNRRIRW